MNRQIRSHSQFGGALLGQGAFACTFDPAPPCAGGKVFEKISGLPAVGKLSAEDVDDELAIGKAIMALPLAAQYFALPSASCKAGDPSKDPDAKGCRVLTEADKGTKFSILLMPAAGKQLLRWATDLQRAAVNFERIFRHLLEGMVIYHNAGYIHNDIHMGNILVDDAGVARYIDFGLGYRLADVQTWDDANLGNRFRPKHIWQAPEVHARRMVKNGVWVADGVKQLEDLHREYVRMIRYFPSRKPAKEALESFIKSAPQDGREFVHTYAKKFDCWRIGLCMFMIWEDLMKGLVTVPNIGKIRRAISGLTEFDPRLRISAAEALYMLDPQSRLGTAPVPTSFTLDYSDRQENPNKRVPLPPTATTVQM